MKISRSSFLVLPVALILSACGGNQSDPVTAEKQAAPVASAKASAAAVVASDYYRVVQQLYVGYFGRPADKAGLDYYAQSYLNAGAQADVNGISTSYGANAGIKALVDSFATSKESQELYAGDNSAFIDAVYKNLFGRQADTAGKNYWADLLDKGAITRSSAALSIMAGAQTTDAAGIDNKTSVALSFTNALTTPDLASAYSGMGANAIVRTMLANVSHTTDVSAFQTSIASTIAGLQNNTQSAITLAKLQTCRNTDLITIYAPDACLVGTITGKNQYTQSLCTLTISPAGEVSLSSDGVVLTALAPNALPPHARPGSGLLYSKATFANDPAQFIMNMGSTIYMKNNAIDSIRIDIISPQYVTASSAQAGFDTSAYLFAGIKAKSGPLACSFTL